MSGCNNHLRRMMYQGIISVNSPVSYKGFTGTIVMPPAITSANTGKTTSFSSKKKKTITVASATRPVIQVNAAYPHSFLKSTVTSPHSNTTHVFPSFRAFLKYAARTENPGPESYSRLTIGNESFRALVALMHHVQGTVPPRSQPRVPVTTLITRPVILTDPTDRAQAKVKMMTPPKERSSAKTSTAKVSPLKGAFANKSASTKASRAKRSPAASSADDSVFMGTFHRKKNADHATRDRHLIAAMTAGMLHSPRGVVNTKHSSKTVGAKTASTAVDGYTDRGRAFLRTVDLLKTVPGPAKMDYIRDFVSLQCQRNPTFVEDLKDFIARR